MLILREGFFRVSLCANDGVLVEETDEEGNLVGPLFGLEAAGAADLELMLAVVRRIRDGRPVSYVPPPVF